MHVPKKLLVTGSSGLIGSEVVDYFCRLGWEVHGVDNNMRADFFGPGGDTRWNQRRLQRLHANFHHHELDIRNRAEVLKCLEELQPAAVVHTAAQPSHDLAASRPFDDFDVNAVGTLNLLEATRRHVPEAVVRPHEHQQGLRRPAQYHPPERTRHPLGLRRPGLRRRHRRDFSIDQSKHSLFGASKVAGDVMVQEYGRYFGMKTCCLRGGA